MKRGKLRVLLGAAPGVGKTYAMLQEGRRLREEGLDVVAAVVETHGRSATAEQLNYHEVLPRRRVSYQGVELEEMDVPALISRAPRIALIDELAHTNAPGSVREKRWQDVHDVLDAGIDVIATVNIQHIDSLNDVIAQITGVLQRETIPDHVVRGAEQIEMIDLAPDALQTRLSAGLVYPAERVDAALSNYFRLGNLTALRELTLLWLADEVDSALQRYRKSHRITETWETRERVVVALTGGTEGETLLRRGARIASRSGGGELLAVHVSEPDGLRRAQPEALEKQRLLVEKLGGTYHQVIGDDIASSLVEFARGVNATQLVMGVSRRGRLHTLLTGSGIGSTVIRESGDIDVHMVTHAAAGSRFVIPRPASIRSGALTLRRRLLGFLLALVVGPLLTWMLSSVRTPESITGDVLTYQLLVVVVALVGGLWPALFAAVLSGLTLDFFFVEPLYTVTIADPLHLVALLLYALNAVLVSYVVDQAAKRTRIARRAAAESELLSTISASVLKGGNALEALAETIRTAFSMQRVLIRDGSVQGEDQVLMSVGQEEPDAASVRIPLGTRGELELWGREIDSSERRILGAVGAHVEMVLYRQDLEETAREVEPLAAADRVRSALLSAVSHDVRRPLAAATAAISGLRDAEVRYSQQDREELLETAQESLEALGDLLGNLLDATRIQAGSLGVIREPLEVGEVILPALDELGVGPDQVELVLGSQVPPVMGDRALSVRVVVNVLSNALRFSPPNVRVRLATSSVEGRAEIRVVDFGPGVHPEKREEIFTAFQRLGDTDNSAGLGLGLALSKGFMEGMGGTLDAEETPGGGLTMVIGLPIVQEAGERI